MKKSNFILLGVLMVTMLTSCFHDDEQLVVKTVKQNHSFYLIDEGYVQKFDYAFDTKLKSTLADTTIQYIKIVSYFSKDYGQRNIYELQVFDSAGVNILYGDTLVTYTSNRDELGSMTNVADGDTLSQNGRWSSLRVLGWQDDSINVFTDTLNLKIASTIVDTVDGIINFDYVKLDSIVNYTVYPDFDTVVFQVNLNKPVNVESIKLFLGEWTQVFDVWVSVDGQTWTMLKPEDYITIYNK